MPTDWKKVDSKMNYESELRVAIEAVKQASVLCTRVQGAIDEGVMQKDDRSPVTVADYGSQALVCRALAAEFPNDPVIGEEDSAALNDPENAGFMDRIRNEVSQCSVDATDSQIREWIDRGASKEFCDRFWTLDPIDGTKGFLRKQQFAVSLGLIVNGQIVVSALACPNLSPLGDTAGGTVYSAVKGQGSWCQRLGSDEAPASIRVSDVAESAAARLCESVESGHSAHGRSAQVSRKLGISREPVRLDSQAKYSVVARGEADIYLRLPTRPDYREKIWDHAGGVLVVEEAGGRITDVEGRDLDFTKGYRLEDNRGVIVSNGNFHDDIVRAVGEVFAQ